MNVADYLQLLNNWHQEENKFEDFNKTELEILIINASKDPNGIRFSLNALFQKSDNAFELNAQIVKEISKTLNLLFSYENEIGNVCFANHPELRSEFRQSFTALDLMDYVFAFIHSEMYVKLEEIEIGSETNFFWRMVEIGVELRKDIK